MLNTKFILIALIFISSFHACKKESFHGSEDTRLQMTVFTSGDSVYYRTFVYDNQNRVTAILDSSNGWYKHRLFIEYNSEGNPFKATDFTNGNYDGSFTQVSFSLVYDANGKIIRKIILTPGGSIVQNTYSYDSKNRLTADSMYSFWTGKIVSYATFSYDGNDNMIQRKEFDEGSGVMTQHQQMSYDSRSNPFKGQELVFYFFMGDDFSLNTNNRIRTEYEDGTIVNYDYEYNKNGLPKRFSERDNTDPLISYLDFSYE